MTEDEGRQWRRIAIALMIALFVLAALYGPDNDPQFTGVSRQGSER